MFDTKGFIFWPVGCGDSTTIVIDQQTIMQVDLRHLAASDAPDDHRAPIIDELVANLPKRNGRPYLSAFVLSHPDKDHILGFADLLKVVTIGELWFTPRVFRDYEDENVLCDDAEAFRREAMRRVRVMIAANGAASAGDRVRLIGFDDLLLKDGFRGFPRAFHTVPGHAISIVDGADLTGRFRAFIHAPFLEDNIADDRNETSVAMQVVLGGRPEDGGVLLFGDLSYPTIRRIFDETRRAGRMHNLAWRILLAPHHCSKSVMYERDAEGGLQLKRDILDEFENAQVGNGYVVASCERIPDSNSKGDNPPHWRARDRYQEIANGGFLCTHEEGDDRMPIEFAADDWGHLTYLGPITLHDDHVAQATSQARGGSAPPTERVGFGNLD